MKIKDFTPIFDSVVRKYDPYTALVYGKIWRICDWSEMSICSMSNEKIATQLGISEKTVRRKKDLLEEGGLIRKVGRQGETDTVTVCHDVVLSLAPDFEGLSADFEGKNRDTESDKESIKKEKEDILISGQKLHDSITGEIFRHFKLSPSWDTKANRDFCQFLKERRGAGQNVGTFARWWFENDWRGQQGQSPSVKQIREMWFQAFEESEESDPFKGANIVT